MKVKGWASGQMKKRAFRLQFLLLLLTIVIGSLMTACDQQSSASAPEKNELSDVTLRVAQTGWSSIEEELKAAGLDNTPYKIDYSVFQGGNLQLEAMAGGHIDFSLSSEIPPIFANLSEGNGNFKVVAVQEGNTLNQEVVVPKNSSIKTVADLKGKRVAYVKNTTAHYFLLKLLKEAGLEWKDIKPVELSTSDGLTALLGGNVDAFASYGVSIISAHEKGAKTIASGKDILSGNFLITVPPKLLEDKNKKAALVDLLDRLQKAHKWTRENQEQWAKVVATNTHQPVNQALTTLKEGEEQRPSIITPITTQQIKSEQDVADTFYSESLLKEKIDVKKFWTKVLNSDLEKIVSK
jgi:sulfonate transport system substrate-binding protein